MTCQQFRTRDVVTHNTDTVVRTTDVATRSTDVTTHSADVFARSRDVTTHSTDFAAHSTDFAAHSTDFADHTSPVAILTGYSAAITTSSSTFLKALKKSLPAFASSRARYMTQDACPQEDAYTAEVATPIDALGESVDEVNQSVTPLANHSLQKPESRKADVEIFKEVDLPKSNLKLSERHPSKVKLPSSEEKSLCMPFILSFGSDQQNGCSQHQDLQRSIFLPGRHEVTIVASDSDYSYFMESDFQYYFQHPYLRLLTVYSVMCTNFLLYAEDPVVHSRKECEVVIIGNTIAFIFTRYAPNAWSLLKVVMWLAGIFVGLFVGKVLFHSFIFNTLFRLDMFSDDKGSWMTMFLSTILSLVAFSSIYNSLLLFGGEATAKLRISPAMGVSFRTFTKLAAIATWFGDFFTAWMVTDVMLQERLYPLWAVRPRKWWNKGYRRIFVFWAIITFTSGIFISLISLPFIVWDKLNLEFLQTNELTRAFLSSLVLVLDVIVVMQDWDFPHFIGAVAIKLPGVNVAHIFIKIPALLKCLQDVTIHISGKWFNYGLLFLIIMLDMNTWENQIFYEPHNYAQYTDPENRIYSITDDYSLKHGNETTIDFAYRNSTIDPTTGKRYIESDEASNSRHYEYSIEVKALAFVPSIGIFIIFGAVVWFYGRLPEPTKEDPYGGRLKVRKKEGFTLRLGYQRLRRRFHAHSSGVREFCELNAKKEKT